MIFQLNENISEQDLIANFKLSSIRSANRNIIDKIDGNNSLVKHFDTDEPVN